MLIGYIFLKYNDKVERAKIDKKWFYFKPLTGIKYDKLSLDLNPFEFVSYKNIENIILKKNFFRWEILELKTKNWDIDLLSLDVLKPSEKQEIFSVVKDQIKKTKKKRERNRNQNLISYSGPQNVD